ncbi:unnamed protein product [Caenorhabditis auriculariae]|uniref:Ubiquitin-like domain-containing protein n=1 Tax=Caenorhabditis auriculariae TaxID=2777116 RepID=A0A8S1HCN4_9PELO|nr:unnamed protein product [Caenorhabditis auriculariae]
MFIIIDLSDHENKSHDSVKFKFQAQDTIELLQDKISSSFRIAQDCQRIFDSNGSRIDLVSGTLEKAGLRDNETLVLKHAALKHWANRNDRKASAYLAIDLSAQLESSKFLLAYSDFGTTWVQKRGQAMRLIDRLLPAFKESAKAFFASLDPESTVEFEPKTVGIMSGTIAKVMNGDTLTRYYLKTYHRSATAKVISTSDRFPPDLIETFVYRFLNYIDTGPIVYFPYYSKIGTGQRRRIADQNCCGGLHTPADSWNY